MNYTNYNALTDTLDYDFSREKEWTYAGLDMEQIVKRISAFTSSIWQSHPFMEGNTRTTAVCMECDCSIRTYKHKDLRKSFRKSLCFIILIGYIFNLNEMKNKQ